MNHLAVPRHPLNVKPSGNHILLSDKEVLTFQERWSKDLGLLSIFSDELLYEIISLIDNASDLKNFGHASRILYAFTYQDELWKNLYLQHNGEDSLSIDWKGSWRKTLLRVNEEAKPQCPNNLLCSDLLFRPYQCSKIDYNELCRRIIAEEKVYHKKGITEQPKDSFYRSVLRIPEKEVSLQYFEKNLINRPFILTNSGVSDRWPSWSLASLLERFPKVNFRQESVKWSLEAYSRYLSENSDESPLYLFDCDSSAISQLSKEYQVPVCFQNDLFTVLNEESDTVEGKDIVNCRPNFRWLIIGSSRTGSTFHKDPNSTCAWNAVLSGCKLWIMIPPHLTPPGVGTDKDESEVTSPVSLAEFFLSGFFNDILKLSKDHENEVYVSVVFAGECNYVPKGWWHLVVNIDDTVALTQNFVPSPVLPSVLEFFERKSDQISGFHSAKLVKSLNVLLERMEKIDSSDADFILRKQSLKKYIDSHETKSAPKTAKRDILHDEVDDDEEICEIPLLEAFEELLIEKGYSEVLESAILQNQVKNSKKQTKGWHDVVQSRNNEEQGQSSGFAFDFDLCEDSD